MGLAGHVRGSGQIPVRSIFAVAVLVLLGALVCVNGQTKKEEDPETHCLGKGNEVKPDHLIKVKTMTVDIRNKTKDFLTGLCNRITKDFITGRDGKWSFFDTFTQAYHTLGIPVSRTTWVETYFFFESMRPALVEIRELNRDYEKFQQYHGKCKKYHDEGVASNALPEDNRTLDDCIRISKILVQCIKFNEDVVKDLLLQTENRWLERYHTACYESVALLMDVFLKAAKPLYVNSRPPQWLHSPFYLMYQDTLEYTFQAAKRLLITFQNYINKIRADGDEATATALETQLAKMNARTNQFGSPYFTFFFYIKYDINILFDLWTNTIKDFANDVQRLYEDKAETKFGRLSHKEYIYGWRHDDKRKTNFTRDVFDQTFPTFATKLKWIYERYFEVDRYDPPVSPYDGNGNLKRDGMWNWKPDIIFSGTNLTRMHNMRLAWDLMGALQEELKCYMKETYFFDLRQKAIRDTQLDLKKGALFTGISTTMFKPCRISYENEADLVTPYCTAENHEICAPMAPFHPLQRSESIYHGGLGLLRPKWVYWYDEKHKKCVGRKDYVSMMYVCRCGFRLDCGDDLGENITCQLVPNDLLRGQCRGGVGYPCKTLPLSPGKHNQTCASGYCNMRKNSCEDTPLVFQKSDGAPIWKAHVLKHRFLVHFLAALALVAFVYGCKFNL